MPYIKREDRTRFEEALISLSKNVPETPGELNYLFSTVASMYLSQKREVRYQYLNDIMGALEGAKLEIYRRIAAPHEDLAMKKNGDL